MEGYPAEIAHNTRLRRRHLPSRCAIEAGAKSDASRRLPTRREHASFGRTSELSGRGGVWFLPACSFEPTCARSMLSFLALSTSLLMPRGWGVRPTDSSTPARSPASRMNNLPNGPASLPSTRTWLQKNMMHQLKEATCDENVCMVEALLLVDYALFAERTPPHQLYSSWRERYAVPRRGGYDLTRCIIDATDESEVTPLVRAIRLENVELINVFTRGGRVAEGGS